MKTILLNAEKISQKSANNWLLPYEYICWKNLLNDVEADIRTFEDILSAELKKKSVTHSDIDKLFNMDFTAKWFMNAGYSDEFDYLLQQDTADLNKLVNDNIYKVFYPEEQRIWTERLISTSYLKFCENERHDAELLYSLYFDEAGKQEFLKNILKKSIYEYYVSLKFNTELNNGRYTLKELDEIISAIEEMWVCTK